MPQGGTAQSRKTNVHDLINGEVSLTALGGRRPDLDDQTMTITSQSMTITVSPRPSRNEMRRCTDCFAAS
jgi:hypothetical protein